MAELGIAVAVFRMLLAIFLPQQLLGHRLVFEFQVDGGEVWFRKTPLASHRLGWKEEPTEITLTQVFGNGPTESCLLGSGQVIHHGAVANIERLGDGPIAQPSLMPKTQNVFNFAHC